MASYTVIHKETGETKMVEMSITEWDQWKEDNPEWQRDWVNHGFGGVVSDKENAWVCEDGTPAPYSQIQFPFSPAAHVHNPV